MDITTKESASSIVFSIAELREAILIEYALLLQQDYHCNALHHRGPVVELFPLQRINHAFSTTIRQSPELRSFMCGADDTSPLYWFLSTRGMYRRWGGWRKPREARNERFGVYTNLKDVGEEKWVMSKKWMQKEASWRKIKVFWDDVGRRGFELDFMTDPYSSDKLWVLILRRGENPTLGTVDDCIQEMVHYCEPEIRKTRRKLMVQPPPHESAMFKVWAIAELREAILVEYALLMYRQTPPDQYPSPAHEMFPLQRVCHAFANTICHSPQLRNHMCLPGGGSFPSPLDWFLSTLYMQRVALPQDGHFQVRTNMDDGEEERWVLPVEKAAAVASWRRIRIFPEDYDGPALQLDFISHIFGPSFPENWGRIWERFLLPEDNPTLETVYTFIEEVVHDCQSGLQASRQQRIEREREEAERTAAQQIEMERRRIAYYGEEIHAAYPRGSTPLSIREKFQERYSATERAIRKEFLAWRKEQRQREYEGDLMKHRKTCECCGEFDVDEG